MADKKTKKPQLIDCGGRGKGVKRIIGVTIDDNYDIINKIDNGAYCSILACIDQRNP